MCNISVSIISLVLHSTSISPLVFLFYYLSFDTYHNYPHIFLYLLLLLAITNSLSLILLSSTFFHVLLLVHYNVTGLSLLLTSHLLVYISFISLILNLPLSALNTLTPIFFIFSTVLTIFLSLPLAIF